MYLPEGGQLLRRKEISEESCTVCAVRDVILQVHRSILLQRFHAFGVDCSCKRRPRVVLPYRRPLPLVDALFFAIQVSERLDRLFSFYVVSFSFM